MWLLNNVDSKQQQPNLITQVNVILKPFCAYTNVMENSSELKPSNNDSSYLLYCCDVWCRLLDLGVASHSTVLDKFKSILQYFQQTFTTIESSSDAGTKLKIKPKSDILSWQALLYRLLDCVILREKSPPTQQLMQMLESIGSGDSKVDAASEAMEVEALCRIYSAAVVLEVTSCAADKQPPASSAIAKTAAAALSKMKETEIASLVPKFSRAMVNCLSSCQRLLLNYEQDDIFAFVVFHISSVFENICRPFFVNSATGPQLMSRILRQSLNLLTTIQNKSSKNESVVFRQLYGPLTALCRHVLEICKKTDEDKLSSVITEIAECVCYINSVVLAKIVYVDDFEIVTLALQSLLVAGNVEQFRSDAAAPASSGSSSSFGKRIKSLSDSYERMAAIASGGAYFSVSTACSWPKDKCSEVSKVFVNLLRGPFACHLIFAMDNVYATNVECDLPSSEKMASGGYRLSEFKKMISFISDSEQFDESQFKELQLLLQPHVMDESRSPIVTSEELGQLLISLSLLCAHYKRIDKTCGWDVESITQSMGLLSKVLLMIQGNSIHKLESSIVRDVCMFLLPAGLNSLFFACQLRGLIKDQINLLAFVCNMISMLPNLVPPLSLPQTHRMWSELHEEIRSVVLLQLVHNNLRKGANISIECRLLNANDMDLLLFGSSSPAKVPQVVNNDKAEERQSILSQITSSSCSEQLVLFSDLCDNLLSLHSPQHSSSPPLQTNQRHHHLALIPEDFVSLLNAAVQSYKERSSVIASRRRKCHCLLFQSNDMTAISDIDNANVKAEFRSLAGAVVPWLQVLASKVLLCTWGAHASSLGCAKDAIAWCVPVAHTCTSIEQSSDNIPRESSKVSLVHVEAVLCISDIYEYMGHGENALNHASEARSLVKSFLSDADPHSHVAELVSLHTLRILHRLDSRKLDEAVKFLSESTADSYSVHAAKSLLAIINSSSSSSKSALSPSSKSLEFRHLNKYWNQELFAGTSSPIAMLPYVFHSPAPYNFFLDNQSDPNNILQSNYCLPFDVVRYLRRTKCVDAVLSKQVSRSSCSSKDFVLGASSIGVASENVLLSMTDGACGLHSELVAIRAACSGDKSAICAINEVLLNTVKSCSMVVCFIACDPVTGSLLIGRFSSETPGLVVSLPLQSEVARVMSEWNQSIDACTSHLHADVAAGVSEEEKSSDSVKREWWNQRKQHDANICEWLSSFNDLLGPWICMLVDESTLYPSICIDFIRADVACFKSMQRLADIKTYLASGSSTKKTSKPSNKLNSVHDDACKIECWTRLVVRSLADSELSYSIQQAASCMRVCLSKHLILTDASDDEMLDVARLFVSKHFLLYQQNTSSSGSSEGLSTGDGLDELVAALSLEDAAMEVEHSRFSNSLNEGNLPTRQKSKVPRSNEASADHTVVATDDSKQQAIQAQVWQKKTIAELKQELTLGGVAFGARATKAELLELLRKHHVKPTSCINATKSKAGHKTESKIVKTVTSQTIYGNLVLMLGEDLQCVPIENIAFLKKRPCTRIPGLALLLELIQKRSGNTSSPTAVSAQNVWYSVDPEGNLPGTADTMTAFLKPYVDRFQWTGVVSQLPSMSTLK